MKERLENGGVYPRMMVRKQKEEERSGECPFSFRERLGLAVRDNIYTLMGWKELKELAEAGGGREVLWEWRDAKLVWVLTSQSGFLTFPQHPNTCLSVLQCPLPEMPTPWSLLYSCLPVQVYLPMVCLSLSHLTMICPFLNLLPMY